MMEPAVPSRLAALLRSPELIVGSGAVIGVLGRFLMSSLGTQLGFTTWPWATLVINLVGCFGIGIVQTLFFKLGVLSRTLQLLLAVGVLGGFTTFSTFSVETLRLLQAGRGTAACLYQAISLMGGILAVLLGSLLTERSVMYRRSLRA